MRTQGSMARTMGRRLVAGLGAIGATAVLFLVLPILQAISAVPAPDSELRSAETTNLPPPPPPPEPEPEKPPEQPEKQPELAEEPQTLDLSQLELALNPGAGGDGTGAMDFAVKLGAVDKAGAGDDVDALFSLADLDQKPRAVHQPSPSLTAEMRRKAPATVWVIFVVNQEGRVEEPAVQSSSDPLFERPALNAIRQWRFEPGKRSGQPVRFRMRVPFTFPKA